MKLLPVPLKWSEVRLNKQAWYGPGVVLHMADGKKYLVGDMNELGGVCDDCCDIGYHDIIIGYERIWTPPGSEKLS